MAFLFLFHDSSTIFMTQSLKTGIPIFSSNIIRFLWYVTGPQPFLSLPSKEHGYRSYICVFQYICNFCLTHSSKPKTLSINLIFRGKCRLEQTVFKNLFCIYLSHGFQHCCLLGNNIYSLKIVCAIWPHYLFWVFISCWVLALRLTTLPG